jgi:hypothetical protein
VYVITAPGENVTAKPTLIGVMFKSNGTTWLIPVELREVVIGVAIISS